MTEVKKILNKNLEKSFEIKVPVHEIQEEINKEAEKQQKNAKIDGFRKGKVPLDFIKNKFSATLLSTSAENIVEKNVKEIIKTNKFELLNRPKINVKTLENNQDFIFEVIFELLPEIPDIKYEKIKLKKQKVIISKNDIEIAKQRLLKSKATFSECDDKYKTKKGDVVKINFLGKIDNVPFEGGKAEGYDLELGSKSFIDNFEEQLLDKKLQEAVEVKVNFPKDYGQKNLAGKSATFEVKICEIKTPQMPVLTDEYLKENFNIESILKLEEMITKELELLHARITKDKIKGEIFDWLKKNVKIELSDSIIEDEFNREWDTVEQDCKKNPNRFKNEAEKEKEKKDVKQNAEDSLKLGFIMSNIGKKNKIEVQNTELIEEMRRIASSYPGQEQMIIDLYMKNDALIKQLTGTLLESKVVDFIINNANVEIVEVNSENIATINK